MRLPRPPEALRVGPFREGAFRSTLHDEQVAARLGLWLGVTFTVCMVTGLVSHVAQHPPGWLPPLPSRPVQLYRVNQGLHTLSGLCAVPLLLAKLFAVYPRFFTWPPARDVGHALERASLLLLVGGCLAMIPPCASFLLRRRPRSALPPPPPAGLPWARPVTPPLGITALCYYTRVRPQAVHPSRVK